MDNSYNYMVKGGFMSFVQKAKDYELNQEHRAEWIQQKAQKDSYERFKMSVETFLEDYEDLESDLKKLKKVTELANWLTDLELDYGFIGNEVNYLSDNLSAAQKALDNILDILYSLKEV